MCGSVNTRNSPTKELLDWYRANPIIDPAKPPVPPAIPATPLSNKHLSTP